jgi:hypothetical protein
MIAGAMRIARGKRCTSWLRLRNTSPIALAPASGRSEDQSRREASHRARRTRVRTSVVAGRVPVLGSGLVSEGDVRDQLS